MTNTSKLRVRTAVAALTIAGTLFTASAGIAADRTQKSANASANLYQSFDWHAPRRAMGGRLSNVALKRRYASMLSSRGRGSFVCSPSGSGRKSSCSSR